MLLLLLGLSLFLGVHLVPMRPGLRTALVLRLGDRGYRNLFSLISVVGFVLLVWGKANAPYVPLWSPPPFGRTAAFVLLAGTALASAALYLPTNLKRITAHPMLWGTLLWALGHLLANGDLASLVLFGLFFVYAWADMVSANRRGARTSTKVIPVWRDGVVLVLAAVIYLVVLWAHPWLSGVSLVRTVAPRGADSCVSVSSEPSSACSTCAA